MALYHTVLALSGAGFAPAAARLLASAAAAQAGLQPRPHGRGCRPAANACTQHEPVAAAGHCIHHAELQAQGRRAGFPGPLRTRCE